MCDPPHKCVRVGVNPPATGWVAQLAHGAMRARDEPVEVARHRARLAHVKATAHLAAVPERDALYSCMRYAGVNDNIADCKFEVINVRRY